jgi:transposase, IS30 family
MRRPWQRLSPSELKGLWDHWKRGQTLRAISAALQISDHSIYEVVVRHGGVPPQPRQRAARALTLGEREEISRGLRGEESIRAIARRLGRAPSTVSREIRRHYGAPRYRAVVADQRAWRRATRPKARRLATQPRLRRIIFAKIRADWSPEQISAWLKRTFPADPRMQLSHEAIYQSLYVQARGALKRELVQHLRRQRGLRRSGPKRPLGTTGRIIDGVSIAERPAAAADRAVPGHWEGDLLFGRPGSFVATLVERRSRYLLLVRVPSRESRAVVRALARHVRRLPTSLRQSLTWDRGTEMATHRTFTMATKVQVYFCDPQSPWQRGSNENTNGLLRQYFPKGADLSNVTQRQLDVVARKLNTRPRETLLWRTPAEVLAETVAPTG